MKRRDFLITTLLSSGLIISDQLNTQAVSIPEFSNFPFSLGVASGDPLSDRIIIWTRLAPNPLKGGGMPKIRVPVQWKVAKDPKMIEIVRQGTVMATPELGHAVHVDVTQLEANQVYWYQFQVGEYESAIARTKTLPNFDASVDKVSFAFASCQDWQNGYYVAHKHLAEEDLDFVVFLGDYIYERSGNQNRVRQHQGDDCLTLEDYRNRYAQYKGDPNLQASHHRFPWIMTWDDHEVDNNYANLTPEDNQSLEAFQARRKAAYQAYYEHTPIRVSFPPEEDITLYRSFDLGNLGKLMVLDTRQYRSDQPCGDGGKPRCQEAKSETTTLLGTEQEQWLQSQLSNSSASWNIIAQQIMMAQYDLDPRPNQGIFNMDQWDGYIESRHRLLNFLHNNQISNPVVITGDIHSSWVNDLKLDFDDPRSPTVATEFVGTSISSQFPQEYIAPIKLARIVNPHVKFFEGTKHGYVRCTVTPEYFKSDYRVVSSVLDPDASVDTLQSFVVKNGQPGVLAKSTG
ncbi:phosphodiesterase/alkaline phosphatase D [Crocosphaera subtropica ATCC 51142]|uniref:Phosphodiesterase/alkaline phosphatase D n=1 Tax=Crocosphaera subtropica (strain ATCC 51142 / BH68) TaxID=43989 RepID=B1WTK7_CROS5|nr:alkaline phosphatase D family protein [Crocosphaera subtropica]ACB53722.1 phosphodiesterase/alkaline phosphatase D [Crocosphaera subtropica ATCC 51142]